MSLPTTYRLGYPLTRAMKEKFLAFKKLFFVAITAILGLLLALAGVSLISLSLNLVLYSGIALLILAALFYFLS